MKEVKGKKKDVTEVAEIKLNEAEKALIESQRKEGEKLERFKTGYQELIKETGYAWGIDGNSTLNAPKLGIGKINQ